MVTYQYTYIEQEQFAFRLLMLCMGHNEDPVRCRLFDTQLLQDHDDPYNVLQDYTTLSCTWGDMRKMIEIEIDDLKFCVTENLFSALQHLRSEIVDQMLWVDAICINQENDKERSHQVQQMRNIHQEAGQLCVWLGESTTNTDVAMDAMRDLEKSALKIDGDWRLIAKAWILRNPFDKAAGIKFDFSVECGFKELVACPWFRRVWILQEVAMAKSVRITCGQKSVSARIFAQFPGVLNMTLDDHCQAVLDIMPGHSCKVSWWAQNKNLHTLLLKFRECGASDQRDKIYALLGISTDAFDPGAFEFDYNDRTTVKEVVQRNIRFILSVGSCSPSVSPNSSYEPHKSCPRVLGSMNWIRQWLAS